jgi:hypothetical protein
VEEQDIDTVQRRHWLRRRRFWAGLLLLLLVAGLLVLWSMRVRLATGYVDRELARRGVEASYDVRRIGFGSQVLENVVIGDPRRPDAIARRVEVEIDLGLTGPRVGRIRVRGARLYGRLRDGRVEFGQIDRLLPPPSGLPFRLPDQWIDVADTSVGIETPAGPVGFGLEGQGNLADGFRGRLALVADRLEVGECSIARPRANVAISVDDLRPSVEGPLAIDTVNCDDGLAIERPIFALDATLEPALDGWRGETALRAARLQVGRQRFAGLEGRLTFSGDADNTVGRVELGSALAAVATFAARRTGFEGSYAVSSSGDLALRGDARVEGLTLSSAATGELASSFRAGAGTPIGPIGAALATAIERAARGGGEASAGVRLVQGEGFGALRIERLRYAARSGLALRTSGGEGFTYYWPSGGVRLDGEFALGGGGFPLTQLRLSQASAGAPLEGFARVAPIQTAGARLELGEVRFAAGADGRTSFATALRVDGPIGSGRVTGLTLPVRGRFGRGGLVIGENCVNAGFQALEIEGLRIGPSRLPLCPTGPALLWQPPGGSLRGGAELRAPRFAGRLGGSPISLAAGQLRVDLEGFVASDVGVRLGAEPSVHRLDLARLDGRFTSAGVSGSFTGASGKIANVPLLIAEGAGSWQVVGGNLSLDGRLQVADAQDPARFHPLVSEDFQLTLAGSRIHAGGWLNHPATGTRVTLASVDHHLGTGAGEAVLDVPGLAFGQGFQPEALTPLTLGVVALVDGTVTGQGRIAWDSNGVRSSGTFGTQDLDLAAPFGPVEGLATTIRFTDLLGLVSAPGQVARADVVRAGIDVYDGTVTYQLLPNFHVQVESGRWPFAGGELFLEPTLLDFSQPSTKYLTFRVVGMDAATFVQQMEFSNIAATGTFDGIIPMQFDLGGGRIIDGRMIARAPGGTLSYIGELTDRDLGAYGILAFNALKSLRYSRFDVTLNGALDGEFVTIIDLDGIARDPSLTTLPSGGGIPEMVAGRVLGQLSRIPFEFNIRIEGQFRALIATARSFEDPTPLIQSVLPQVLREGTTTTVDDVQDEESEPVQ